VGVAWDVVPKAFMVRRSTPIRYAKINIIPQMRSFIVTAPRNGTGSLDILFKEPITTVQGGNLPSRTYYFALSQTEN